MKLYLVHVGFYDETFGIYESHVNYFVVAQSPSEAKEKIKSKSIFKEKKMHIDGMQEINEVDGFSVHLQPSQESIKENQIFKYDAAKIL